METSPKIRFFTRIAYQLMTSKYKYYNVFFVMAGITISFMTAVHFAMKIPGAFSAAALLSSVLTSNVHNDTLQKAVTEAWNAAWNKVMIAGVSLFIMTCCGIIEVKMIKIYRVFHRKQRTILSIVKNN